MWMLQRGVRTSRGQKRRLLLATSADISWPKLRTFPWPRTLENPNLMAEHHDLELLVRLGPPPGDDEPDEPAEAEVDEGEGHGR